MATRTRRPGATATATPSERSSTSERPVYEKPSFPLNPAAQRTLAQLHHNHSLDKLDSMILEAQSALSNAAAEINDRLTLKTSAVEKRRGADNSDGGCDPELEQSLADFRSRVERMTQRMDENMRKMIDGRHNVLFTQKSLKAVAQDAQANAATQISTPQSRSQKRPRRGTGNSGEESDEYEDFEPTNPSNTTQSHESALENFQVKVNNAKTRYQSQSLTHRYAEDNEYKNFRRLVHDARHPDGNVELAHHTEWFQEHDAPAPGVTTRARKAGEEEDDDDDDIAVSRSSISTKCPLTLQELKAPLTSKKCPHSFESEAILMMIASSQLRENGRGERFVQCPVTGCDQKLTRADLHTDAVLVRQIKRIQHAKKLEEEDAVEGDANRGTGQRPMTIIDEGDGADVDDIIEGRVIPRTQMKAEQPSSFGAAAAATTLPRGSTNFVEVLDGSSDEEEAEEDDSMVTDEDQVENEDTMGE